MNIIDTLASSNYNKCEMLGTIIISLILLVLVALIIRYMIKAKRSGKNVLSCGGNCSACGMCGSCKFHAQNGKTPDVKE